MKSNEPEDSELMRVAESSPSNIGCPKIYTRNSLRLYIQS